MILSPNVYNKSVTILEDPTYPRRSYISYISWKILHILEDPTYPGRSYIYVCMFSNNQNCVPPLFTSAILAVHISVRKDSEHEGTNL